MARNVKRAIAASMVRELNRALGLGDAKGGASRPVGSDGFLIFLEPIPGAYFLGTHYQGGAVYRIETRTPKTFDTVPESEWMPYAEFIKYLEQRIKQAV